ncbi:aminotransferase class III-fold pyridoxal phosphate-dependent enzyme [Streptomyces anulatus]|uniref:aspartate aminotransferase family protein n=1 Tax=Streptomyces TaxID=1883 RepID=UPI00067CA71C|nr:MULTISPECIES: aminotransferase class III-fold pyridoxal phosphate-dependent enzyme [Streptomyces]KND31392.1 acetylornithine aminotransferase [Streptomyces europaeiscabiei]KQX37353.1 acetylornithine aminotransferase [Streptomyces sp. Root1295]KRA43579.1 acetylornithine aminotransferase [Streptomyces sp. Root63]MBT1099465.1 aminotransferase class III-fold pyridoxal phosphate-dependent enzyme [Streptomyces sp. Tu10]OKI83523.1 acetylornithine aminotransferase [Streptomyces sp. TSRI0395]
MTVVSENRSVTDTEEEILRLYRAHLSKGRATLAELFGSHMEVESSGAWLTTSDGERFLNAGGYGVFIMGARHPTVVEAVERQLRTHPTATRILLEPTVARAAEALVSVTPPGLDRVHFALSGAEAVETGLKLARAGGHKRTVSMSGGYHGKTLGALSATAKEVYQKPFRPLVPDFTHLPFGDADALRQELAAHPGEVCVIIEPVQGEGGVILPPKGYLRRVEELVREYDGFLILDEVQSGFGRLGEWWGADIDGIVPDVLLAGKALGGGVLPVSAAVATREAFRPFDKDPYVHTATFSGQPLLMAAVQGAIQAMSEGRLVTRALELGGRLLPRITEIARRNIPDLLVEVRGRGLLIGVELIEAGLAGELLIELFNHGVVANHSMNGSSVVRFTPPAILTDRDVDHLLDSFDKATRALISGSATLPGRR